MVLMIHVLSIFEFTNSSVQSNESGENDPQPDQIVHSNANLIQVRAESQEQSNPRDGSNNLVGEPGENQQQIDENDVSVDASAQIGNLIQGSFESQQQSNLRDGSNNLDGEPGENQQQIGKKEESVDA